MGVAAAQRQTAVTAYLKSKQLLLFGFKLRCWSLSNLITTDKLAVEQTHSGLSKKTAGLNSHMRSGVSREGGPEHPPPLFKQNYLNIDPNCQNIYISQSHFIRVVPQIEAVP